MQELPLVSIVTPSYNMAGYLEETIQSVLSQDYPNIEYIVRDGGSADGTLDILRRYQGRLQYVSAPDGGAADAVNQGFRASRGSVFAWLNADDTYLPGAVNAAVQALLDQPDAGAVYGEAYWVDGAGRTISRYPTAAYDPSLLARECFICQPACFMRRALFQSAGLLDPDLQVVFDYDLWIRISRLSRMASIPEYLATSRMHRSNKTLGQRGNMFREAFRLLKRNYKYVPVSWVNTYCAYLIDRRDQFYEPFQPSALKYLLCLPLGWWYNWRHPWRYSTEWYCSSGAARFWKRSAVARMFRSRVRN